MPDTDWDEKTKSHAQKNSILVIASDPCFEAVLLRALEEKPSPEGNLKKQLSPFLKGKSSKQESYMANFSLAALKKMRQHEDTIDKLMKAFQIPAE